MRKKVRPVVLSCQRMSAEAHTERRRRTDGERSRQAILREAARLATVEGVDGLSLGRLADAVGMSKSGLFAHFKSKEELQLARLEAFADRFIAHLRDEVFPGGCFFASTAAELGPREGPVRDRAVQTLARWTGLIQAEVAEAQANGELDPSLDAGQLAFELNAYLLLANAQFIAMGGELPLERAQQAFAARLSAARSGS
jgi:AcrR family transcriptional regulator